VHPAGGQEHPEVGAVRRVNGREAPLLARVSRVAPPTPSSDL
jgi:hypothetical protein